MRIITAVPPSLPPATERAGTQCRSAKDSLPGPNPSDAPAQCAALDPPKGYNLQRARIAGDTVAFKYAAVSPGSLWNQRCTAAARPRVPDSSRTRDFASSLLKSTVLAVPAFAIDRHASISAPGIGPGQPRHGVPDNGAPATGDSVGHGRDLAALQPRGVCAHRDCCS
jgi:hypothetical protein